MGINEFLLDYVEYILSNFKGIQSTTDKIFPILSQYNIYFLFLSLNNKINNSFDLRNLILINIINKLKGFISMRYFQFTTLYLSNQIEFKLKIIKKYLI